MHCHMGFVSPDELARFFGDGERGVCVWEAGPCVCDREAEGLPARAAFVAGALSATVTPAEYERLHCMEGLGGGFGNAGVRIALGLHPWWIADGRCGENDVAAFERLAPEARCIGEVGLDFAPKRQGTEEAQLRAFERMMRACATPAETASANGAAFVRKVITLHSVRAEEALLNVLEDTACATRHACVLHGFSGSFDQLQRAVGLGCYVSVGPRMTASKRGRAYVAAIPKDRLLLETDMPSHADDSVTLRQMADALRTTLFDVAALRKVDADALAARIAATSRVLLA